MQTGKSTLIATLGLVISSLIAPLFASAEKQASVKTQRELDQLYSAYLHIQDNLAKDDYATAQKVSADLIPQLQKYPQDLSPKVKTKILLDDVKALKASQDIAGLRKAFSPFSDHMALVMSSADYQGVNPVLEFECPMANDQKGGRWLQSKPQTANPYFGSAMLTCGTLKNRIREGKTQAHEAHH